MMAGMFSELSPLCSRAVTPSVVVGLLVVMGCLVGGGFRVVVAFTVMICFKVNTIIILNFPTDRSGQTVQTQIRLLLLFHLHLFDKLPKGLASFLEF